MRGAFSTLIVAVAAALTLPAPPAQALVVEVFPPTGAEQTFAVPAGVHKVTVGVLGGKGGGTADAAGGNSVAVIGTLSVTPGQTLYIEVGGNGKPQVLGGAGGFNGGGSASGSGGGGGGGGASDIRTKPRTDGLNPDTRLIISAGGGGAGGTGASGIGGKGGDAGQDGGTALGGDSAGAGGAKGTAGGGEGGVGCNGDGESGEIGLGGDGFPGEVSNEGGGGGGGGLYGGGGGGGGCIFGGGGGGGGSDLVPPGGAKLTTALEPRIEVAYREPPTISITSPVEGATIPQGQVLTASYGCSSSENVSIKECAGSVANGAALDTSTLGPHTLTVEAEDAEKGTASRERLLHGRRGAAGATGTEIVECGPGHDDHRQTEEDGQDQEEEGQGQIQLQLRPSPGATFQCKLDKGAFAPCTSPKSYKVKTGKHTFSVEAVGSGRHRPQPATFSFKVKKKK